MKLRKEEFKKYVFYIISILCFFEIPYLTSFAENAKLYNNIYNIFALILFVAFSLFSLKKKKVSSFLIYLSIFIIYCLIITLFNKGITNLSFFIKILGLCFIADYGIRNDTKIYLKSFEIILWSLIFINLLTVILFPGGLYINPVNHTYQNWLLGYKNSHILYILPALFLSKLNTININNKFDYKFIILIIISIISVMLVDSGTSLVGISIITLMMLFINKFHKYAFFSLQNYLVLFYLFVILIVIFRIQNVFSFIIVDILGRDLTFTGRTSVWDYAISLIKDNIIFGYGDKNFIYYLSTGTVIKSTHNELLQVLYNYGIVGFSYFTLLMAISAKQLKKLKKTHTNYIISAFFLSWFIMMITESYELQFFVYFLVFAFNAKYIDNYRIGDDKL